MDKFTKSEKKIALYILNNPKEFVRQEVEIVVGTLGTSKPTLIRFAKKMGFPGYTEFRFSLSSFLTSSFYEDPTSDNGPQLTLLEEVLNQYSHVVQSISQYLDEAVMLELADLLLKAPRIYAFGWHRTFTPVKHLADRIIRIGIGVSATDRFDMISSQVSLSSHPEDVFLIFSVKNNSSAVPQLLESMRDNQRHSVLITMAELPHNKLASKCVRLPSPGAKYGQFIDEQPIFMVFVELLVAYVAKLKLKTVPSG